VVQEQLRVIRGPGLRKRQVLSHNSEKVDGNGCIYHMRLAVIIPAFPEISHTCASVNFKTWVDMSECLQFTEPP